MLDSLLICNTSGLPFYSRKFSPSSKLGDDPSLLSGLISAIDSIGRMMFNRKVGIINYVEEESRPNEADSHVVIMSKDLFSEDKHINFVFFVFGECDMSELRQVSTSIFIEIKQFLRQSNPEFDKIESNVNHILDTQFAELIAQSN